MPFVPIPDTAKVTMQFECNGEKVLNVWHVRTDAAWSFETLTALATVFETWRQNELRALQGTLCVCTLITATNVTQEGAPGIEFTPVTDVGGGHPNALQPNSVTVAVKLTSGLTGRSHRGRKYHIGLTEDLVGGNQLAPGIAGSLGTAYNALLSFLATGSEDWHLVVASLWDNGVLRTIGETTDITGMSVENNIDSQRRRLAGRGN